MQIHTFARSAALIAFAVLGLVAVPQATHAQDDLYPEERVARIAVDPSVIEVRVGESVPVTIAPVDADGNVMRDILMRVTARGSGAWYDAAASAITGIVPGDELVMARVRRSRRDGPGFDDLFGLVRVTVLPAAVDRITIADTGTALFAGAGRSLAAHPMAGDEARDDAEVVWTSENPQVATVTSGGLAIGVAAGEARLTAHSEGSEASFTLLVIDNPVAAVSVENTAPETRVGDVVHLAATATDDGGRPVVGAPVQWVVLEGEGHVTGDGAFVAYAPGTHRVAARVGARMGVAEIHATERPPRHTVRILSHGVAPQGQATTDLWVFEGVDGRDYTYTGTYSGNLMYAWDVTDPANPVLTDSVAFDGRRVNDVKVNAGATIAVVTSENAANRRNGITLLDLADPAHPERITHFTDGLTGGVHNTWIEGELVYAVHYGTADLHIIDISDPANPARVGRWGLEKPNRWLHDVMVMEGLAYLSYWDDGVIILDVGAGIAGGTPTEPVLVSQLKYRYRLGNDREWYGNTHHTIRYGNYVFAGDEIFGCAECINGPRGYIHVLDVTDIEHPREVAYYRVPEAGAHNMWAEDDKLYIGHYQAGLRVLDISGELQGDLYRQGREIAWTMTEDGEGTVPNTTDTWGAQPYKGAIFASDPNSGLWVVEIVPPEGEPLF